MQYAVRVRHVLVYKSCQFVPHMFICLVCSSLRLYRLLPRGGNLSDSQWPRILWHYTYGQWLLIVVRADTRLLVCFNPWVAGLWCVVWSANVFWRNYGLSWLPAFPLLTAVELIVVERGDTNTRTHEMEVFFFRSDVGIRITTWNEKKKYVHSP